ncbi:Aspartic proteinase A1 isoform 1 [Hibiscus syriacus]|uniref:Aspartic proteinase A1 isoform 1 n=1 Tax=Hibiscus syriacus TaxID=106335 RepID=A0A6A2XLX6_HIBSY|nr:Aspartic proteinase A1 isoform 1 [Hibiscus syriacus]
MYRSIVFLSSSLFFSDFFHVHASQSDHGTAKFKLIHRNSPELRHFRGTSLGPPSNSRERMKQLMRSDHARLQMITQRLIPRRKTVQVEVETSSNMVELPIRSAADIGTGQYFVSFRDGTAVHGFFGNDTAIVRLTNGRKVKVPRVIIGCSEIIQGEFHDIDGVMRLGFEWHSFAVKAAKKFGYKVSYCLVDHLSPSNLANFLVFGEVNDPTTPKMQYTDLFLGIVNPFYAVNISGISINGVLLDIPPNVWDVRNGGGVIVDSGFSLTQLVKPVFDRVVAAFEAPISKFKKVSQNSEAHDPDICFDDTGYKESMMTGDPFRRNEFAPMCVIATVGGPSPEVNTVAPNFVHPKPEWTADGIALQQLQKTL